MSDEDLEITREHERREGVPQSASRSRALAAS
jgi:hypothetical protein